MPQNNPPKKPKAPKFITREGAEIRGDKINVSARKFGKMRLVRRSNQHNATEVVVEKDARASLLRAYTSTRNPK